jgi:hypothetical protein
MQPCVSNRRLGYMQTADRLGERCHSQPGSTTSSSLHFNSVDQLKLGFSGALAR